MIADARHGRRYVLAMGIATIVLLGSIPAINIEMDPLGYARVAGSRPSAKASPQEQYLAAFGSWPVPHGTREAKVLDVAYYLPQSVIFGSSTVWSYVDASYPALREADGRPAFNFGIAGVG